MSLTVAEVVIVNQSLGAIGANQITYAVQTSNEAVQANLHYAQTRDALLRSYLWNFATIRLPLVSTWVTAAVYAIGQYVWTNSLLYKCAIAHTSGTFATDLAAVKWTLVTERPAFGRWSYMYSLPTDCIRLWSAHHYLGLSQLWTREGNYLYTSETVINIKYVKQVTVPTEFDSLFTEVLILKLALKLLHPLAGTNTTQLKAGLLAELKEANARARTVCASEANDTGESSWNNARFTSGKI